MSWTHTEAINLLPSFAGSTLEALVYNQLDELQDTNTAGFNEVGNGVFVFTYAYPDDFTGYTVVRVQGTTTPLVAFPVDYRTVEAANVATTLLDASVPDGRTVDTLGGALGVIARLGTARVAIVSPIASTGELSVIKGDDYTDDGAGQVQFAEPSSLWPDLTGATVTFAVDLITSVRRIKVEPATVAGTVENAGVVGSQIVKIPLVAAWTSALSTGRRNYKYTVVADLTSGKRASLARSYMTVLEDLV